MKEWLLDLLNIWDVIMKNDVKISGYFVKIVKIGVWNVLLLMGFYGEFVSDYVIDKLWLKFILIKY